MNSIKSIFRQHGPFVLGLLVVLLYNLNLLGFNLQYLPGDLGDGRFNNYLLEHAYKFFTFQLDSFWEAPFMYPEEQVISYSDNLLGTVPLYGLFRFMNIGVEQSFQYWFIALNFLNYYCCYLFLKWWTNNRMAGVLGALLFAISLCLISQTPHVQTIPRFAVPLTFWALLLFKESFKTKHFLVACLLLVYQFYCALYLGFFLAVPFGVFLLGIIIKHWSRFKDHLRNRKWILQIIGSGIISLLVLLPLMLPYYERSKIMGLKSFHEIFPTLPSLYSYLTANYGAIVWEPLEQTAQGYQFEWDHHIYVGALGTISFVICIVLLVRTWKKSNKKKVLFKREGFSLFLISGLVCFLLFLRVGDFSLYAIIHFVPGYGALRALTRIVNIELIFFAACFAFLTLRILNRYPKVAPLSFIVLLVLLVVDNFAIGEKSSRISKEIVIDRRLDLIEQMEHVPKGEIVSYEPVDSTYHHPNVYQIDAMMASQALGLKCINGYSATSPQGFNHYWDNPNEETRKIWLDTKGKDVKLHVIP